MDVAAIMVTHNSQVHLTAALASLHEARHEVSLRLVVVDNASSDASVDMVTRHSPDAVVVAMGRNAGYAAALNAGVRTAGPADAYLFLNPDIELSPGCVAALARGLSEPGVGVAAPRQQDERGRLSFSLRREPTLGRAIGEAVLGGRRAGRVDSFGEMVVDPGRYLRPAHVAWASGSMLLIDARCLAEVGEWDESFFLYSEETDFLLRAGDSGFRVRYCPDAVATHIGGDAHTSPRLYALLTLNRIRLFRRRNGRSKALLFAAAVALGEGLRSRSVVHRHALAALLVPTWRRRALTWP